MKIIKNKLHVFSMANSRLLKLILPLDVKNLSMKERFLSILIYTVPLLILALIMFIPSHDFNYLMIWILYCVLFSSWWYYLLGYERLEKKCKIISDIRFGNTYECISKLMAFSAPGIIISAIILGYMTSHLDIGVTISFASVIPALALYLRDDVFNDENCVDGENVILGYIPTWYGLLSLAVGIFGYITAFNSKNLTVTIILIAITLIFQILSVMPDKLNNILFFEVKKKEGCIMLIISIALIFLLISFIITSSFNLNINLSCESIIMKIITYSIAIVLAILILRKIKNMNKK